MELLEVIGFGLAIVIGFTLGLIGGGGSILTVPIMVYVLSTNPVLATGYSLFVVGTTSLFGAASYIKRKLLNYKAALIFATPSFITIYLIRRFIMPNIPEIILTIKGVNIERDLIIMVFFALIMLVSSIRMIRSGKSSDTSNEVMEASEFNYSKILLAGFITGLVTGPIGAGGGFLIVPALVFIVKLPMKYAIGTSLFVIAINSLIGFIGDLGHQPIEWPFLLTFSGFAVIGIFLGSYASRFIHGRYLKIGFGWFVLVMGTYIFTKEIWF